MATPERGRNGNRADTPLGPAWLVPDVLPEKAAKHVARLDLAWPDLEGFVAMHTGTGDQGAWIIRAPRAALEARDLPTGTAAELPVAEGTAWPPIQEGTVVTPLQSRVSALVLLPVTAVREAVELAGAVRHLFVELQRAMVQAARDVEGEVRAAGDRLAAEAMEAIVEEEELRRAA